MNSVLALGNDLEDLVDAYFTGIIDFQGAPGPKPAIEDREKHSLEERPVRRIKRTVDEHIGGVLISSHRTSTLVFVGVGRRRFP
jgi:hypothetical protein